MSLQAIASCRAMDGVWRLRGDWASFCLRSILNVQFRQLLVIRWRWTGCPVIIRRLFVVGRLQLLKHLQEVRKGRGYQIQEYAECCAGPCRKAASHRVSWGEGPDVLFPFLF